MKNIKVASKLIISFTIVIVLAVSVAVVGLRGMEQIKRSADDIYNYNLVPINYLGLIRENFALQRFITRELIIYDGTSESFNNVKKTLEDLETKMEEYIEKYITTINEKKDNAIFTQFLSVYHDIYGAYKKELLLYAGQNQTDKVMELIRTRAAPIVNDISDTLSTSHDLNIQFSEEVLSQNSRLYAIMMIIEVIVLVIAILIVMLLVVYLTGLISKPLKFLSDVLVNMSSTGNMTIEKEVFRRVKVYAAHKDEIGMTSYAIINLLNHIWRSEQTLSQISDGNFSVEVKKLSDCDTIGLSLSKVLDNLNDMFNKVKTAQEDALESSKAKGAFLANMSHEIRTPLNAIIGMSMIAKNARGDEEKTTASIEQIITSSHHLLNILNDVLDVSKIESGKFALSCEPFRLQAAFNEVSVIALQQCSDKNIRFINNIDNMKNLTLIGDKMRINQVLINLLGNAVKFTEPLGEIKLWTEILEENEKYARILCSVTDSGIGISEKQISKLFEPFEQGDSSIASKYGGTGLGLSICYNLVKMMGGTIKVESNFGIGSTFSFEICFEKGKMEDAVSDETLESMDLSDKRLLLAEDIEINRFILSELLSVTGIMIDEAEDGHQAVNMFLQSPPEHYDIIFMDVQMPLMDGYEATRSIRRLDREDAKSIPIIAMTANAFKEAIDSSLAAGMNAHLTKPVELNEIVHALKKYIKRVKQKI